MDYKGFSGGRTLVLRTMPGTSHVVPAADAAAPELVDALVARTAWTVQLAWDHGAISELYDGMDREQFEGLRWSPEAALVVLRFGTAGKLRAVIDRLDAGEVIDAAAEEIACFSNAKGPDSRLFEAARVHAERTGRQPRDVLCMFAVDGACNSVVFRNS